MCLNNTKRRGKNYFYAKFYFNVEKEAERGSRGYVFDYEIDRESVKEITTYI